MELEHKILAVAASLEPQEDKFQQLAALLSRLPDPLQLIDLAVREGLAGFLYKSLLKADLLETLNDHHRQILYTTYYLTIRRNLKSIHALNQFAPRLIENDIQVVLMQGISLLQQVYRDIGLRPMNDIDIWVLPNRYADLVNSLVSQGFERNPIYPDTFSKGEVVLDIHTHILWADRINSRKQLIKIDQTQIFDDTRPINAENPAINCLNSADQFLYLSLHALKHNLERLIWLVDIRYLIADWSASDWLRLTSRAEKLGQQATLYYMLVVLAQIFALRLPADIAAGVDSTYSNFFVKRILNRRVKGRPIPTWGQLMLMSAGTGLRERIAFVSESLFPKPRVLRQVFPNSKRLSNRRLYWKRALQILGSLKSQPGRTGNDY